MTRIWNKRTPLWMRIWVWWQFLRQPKDEFNWRYNLDPVVMAHMCRCECGRYTAELLRRRRRAHNDDIERQAKEMDKQCFSP